MWRIALAAALACASTAAAAQARRPAPDAPYPSRPIRFILPYPPGGATDVIGRLIGQALAERVGQPVVVDNRPGLGGNIGLEATAKAAPDGYTIALPATGVTVSPALYPNLPYQPLRDFAPITRVTVTPNLFIIPAALPAKTLPEFVALARAKPGGYNHGSGGVGSSNHLIGELLNLVAGTKIVHVAYKGTTQAMMDVIAGQIHLVILGPASSAPHIRAGRLRALASTHHERIALLPDVPTVAEAGYPQLDVSVWYGLIAPAGTPPAVVDRLNREVTAILRSADVRERLAAIGGEATPTTPAEFGAFLKVEIERWARVVKESGVRID